MATPNTTHDFTQVPEHLRSHLDQAQIVPEPSGSVAPAKPKEAPRPKPYAQPAVDQSPRRPQADQAQAQDQAEDDKGEQARSRRSYRFNFEYTDLDGKVWAGTFLSELPSIGEEIEIQKRVAKMQHTGGEGELPEATRDTIFALAFMEVCFKERPDWAKDLGKLPEQELFDALAKEVHAHFATFQRRRQRLRSGA